VSGVVYFVQECPTCGRRLDVKVNLLGKKILCEHCRASFLATDCTEDPESIFSCGHEDLMERADHLIEVADSQLFGLISLDAPSKDKGVDLL